MNAGTSLKLLHLFGKRLFAVVKDGTFWMLSESHAVACTCRWHLVLQDRSGNEEHAMSLRH